MKTSHLIIGAVAGYLIYKAMQKPAKLGWFRRRTDPIYAAPPADVIPYDPPMVMWPESAQPPRFFEAFTFADGRTEILRRCPGDSTRSRRTGRCITNYLPYEGYGVSGGGDGGE